MCRNDEANEAFTTHQLLKELQKKHSRELSLIKLPLQAGAAEATERTAPSGFQQPRNDLLSGQPSPRTISAASSLSRGSVWMICMPALAVI